MRISENWGRGNRDKKVRHTPTGRTGMLTGFDDGYNVLGIQWDDGYRGDIYGTPAPELEIV